MRWRAKWPGCGSRAPRLNRSEILRSDDVRRRRVQERVAESRLDRQFTVGSPVPAWGGDIYLPTREGWLYLATVIDLRTRQVLGYSLSERMPNDFVQQALLNAWPAMPAGAGVLLHSDRGGQYASSDFGKTLAARGFVPSMSRKGNCRDNTVAESFFALLKNEEATGVYAIKDAAHAAIASYIHGFYIPYACTRRLAICHPTTMPRS